MLRLLVSLAAFIALGPLVPSLCDLTWHPAEKTKVEKTFTLDSNLRSPKVMYKVGGREYPGGGYALAIEMHERCVFQDEILKLGDGRPEKLARTFDTIEARHVRSLPWFSENKTVEFWNDLAGNTVIFAWDQDEHGWKRSFANHENAESEALKTLEENVDFRAFVPTKSVARGDSWDIDPRAFDVVFLPGGDLGLHLEIGFDEDLGSGLRLARFFAQHLNGWSKGVFRGLREENGVECGVIQIEAHLTADGVDESNVGPKLRAEAEITLEGEILWDSRAHRAHSGDLRGDMKAHVVLGWTEVARPEKATTTFEQEFELTGTMNLLARFQDR